MYVLVQDQNGCMQSRQRFLHPFRDTPVFKQSAAPQGGKVQSCIDVLFRIGRHLHVRGVVTNRDSTPGEIGAGVCARQQARYSYGANGEAGGSFGGRAPFVLRPTETPCWRFLEQFWCATRAAVNVWNVAVHPRIAPPRRNASSVLGPGARAGQTHSQSVATFARKTLVIGIRTTRELLMHTLELVRTYSKTRGWLGILHMGLSRNVSGGCGESRPG